MEFAKLFNPPSYSRLNIYCYYFYYDEDDDAYCSIIISMITMIMLRLVRTCRLKEKPTWRPDSAKDRRKRRERKEGEKGGGRRRNWRRGTVGGRTGGGGAWGVGIGPFKRRQAWVTLRYIYISCFSLISSLPPPKSQRDKNDCRCRGSDPGDGRDLSCVASQGPSILPADVWSWGGAAPARGVIGAPAMVG